MHWFSTLRSVMMRAPQTPGPICFWKQDVMNFVLLTGFCLKINLSELGCLNWVVMCPQEYKTKRAA